MLLQSIAIRDLAGLSEVSIDTFDPGLNVIVGDNEAGKSTILTALRAAIFHRHGSGSRFVKNLAPYGRQVRPQVDLEFALSGTSYRLEKRFLQKPEARLVWPDGELLGDAVEEKLASLFGFSPYSGRGEFDHERHQGAFGLLWVEQGRSPEGIDIGVGRDAVLSSLEAEVGQILGGERGRGLLLAAKALRERHFTDGGQLRRNSELRVAEDELVELDRLLQEKQEAMAALDARIDRLANRSERLSRLRAERVVEEAERALAEARAAEGRREEKRRDLVEAEQALALAAASVERAARETKVHEEAVQAVARAQADASAAAETLAEAQARAIHLQAAMEKLETRRSEAVELVVALERVRKANEERQARERDRDRLARVRKAHDAARQAATRLASSREAVRQGLSEERLRAILSADAMSREAALRLEGAAPSVLFRPKADQRVEMENREVEVARPLRIGRDTIFVLEGFGEVEVTPDAGSREKERACEDARRRLHALLADVGHPDVAAAQEAAALRYLAEADLREAAAELRAFAPDGLDVLAGERTGLEEALEAWRDTDKELIASPNVSEQLESAQAALRELEAAVQEHRVQLQASTAEVARAGALHEHAAAQVERAVSHMSRMETQNSAAALRERLAAAEVARSAKAAVVEMLRNTYEVMDPEAIRLELQRAERALSHLRKDAHALEDEVRALQAELRVAGGQGIGEEIARAQGEREALARRVERLRLEAHAARLLHETLHKADARAREKWFAPIRREVAPYLRLVHPQAEISFDEETLKVTGITRHGVPEEFARLSHGAREQIAVVTRLALAQVLQKGGHPATVILDDALVNTDETRLRRMHLVLQKAAESLQVIVLTCREQDFRGLGAPLIRL